MDKDATQSRIGRVDAHPAVTAGADARAGRAATDGAVTHQTDMRNVLRAIAARIDVILDETVAEGGDPEASGQASETWSPVVRTRATDDASDVRRQALATTVLRISADGRVDVDERIGDAIDDVDPGAAERAAEDADRDAAEGASARAAERRGAIDRQPEVDGSRAQRTEVSTPRPARPAPVRDWTSGALELVAPAATDRSGVEERMRVVRQRLATRRTGATVARVDDPSPRDRRTRISAWRRTDARILIRRLLIGLTIVGASAIVSLLIA